MNLTSGHLELMVQAHASAFERYWLQGEVIRVSARLSPLIRVSLEGCELLGWVRGMSLHVWGKKNGPVLERQVRAGGRAPGGACEREKQNEMRGAAQIKNELRKRGKDGSKIKQRYKSQHLSWYSI